MVCCSENKTNQLNYFINESAWIYCQEEEKSAGLRGLSACLPVSLSAGLMDDCGDRSRLVAPLNQNLQLSLPPSSTPPSSCVTGPTQEQLLLPAPVSAPLHHSLPKPLLGSVCLRDAVHSQGLRRSSAPSHTLLFGSKKAEYA